MPPYHLGLGCPYRFVHINNLLSLRLLLLPIRIGYSDHHPERISHDIPGIPAELRQLCVNLRNCLLFLSSTVVQLTLHLTFAPDQRHDFTTGLQPYQHDIRCK